MKGTSRGWQVADKKKQQQQQQKQFYFHVSFEVKLLKIKLG